MQPSFDHLLRLTLDAMRACPLTHLVSGLDDPGLADSTRCGMPACISGYTEWTATASVLSIGWDWRMEAEAGVPRCVRTSAPRSNVMLLEAGDAHDPWAWNQRALGRIVDAMAWPEITRQAVIARYR